MKLRNLNGAIRKAEGRSVKIRIATPIGVITAGLTKQELMAGFAELGLEPTDETGMTVENGYLKFDSGADVFGYAGLGKSIEGDGGPTFDPDEIGDGPLVSEDDDLLAADEDLLGATTDDVEDLLAV